MKEPAFSPPITLRVWGDFALFCPAHFKADPHTYPVPTPSAMKGLVRSIYGKPEIEVEIRRIEVLKPIRYVRQGVKALMSSPGGGKAKEGAATRFLQVTTMLADVEYLVTFQFYLNDQRADQRAVRSLASYVQETLRRLRTGNQFRQPYFGRKEFVAHWELQDLGATPEPIPLDMELGPMLFDLVPKGTTKKELSEDMYDPVWFRPMLKQGVIEVDPTLYAPYRARFLLRRALTCKRGQDHLDSEWAAEVGHAPV